MLVTNKNISEKLKDIGIKQYSIFYYVLFNNNYELCTKTKNNNYLVISGNNISKIIKKPNEIISAFTLSEINNIIKYYYKYFNINYIFHEEKWIIDKSIFKLILLNYKKRKYIDDINKTIIKKYDFEIDAKGELLLLLLKINFIDINDLK